MILGILVAALLLAIGLAVLFNNPFEPFATSPSTGPAGLADRQLPWLAGSSDQAGRRSVAVSADAGRTPVREPDWPERQVSKVIGEHPIDFDFVPAGRFQMGSDSGPSNQRPARPVRILRGFHMGRNPITVAQFQVFVEATGHCTDAELMQWAAEGRPESPKRFLSWRSPGWAQDSADPVVCVSRRDALAFAAWLAASWGEPMRLPTEAEWEYTARLGQGGDAGANASITAGSNLPPVTPLAESSILEWCLDAYHDSFEGAPTDGSPWLQEDWLPHPAVRFVVRGGPWLEPLAKLRMTNRDARTGQSASTSIGFRIVRSRFAWNQEVTADRAWDQPRVSSAVGSAGSDSEVLPGLDVTVKRLPPGRFELGADGLGPAAQPLRTVSVPGGLGLGVTEVTVGQFKQFVEATGYESDADRMGGGFILDARGEWVPVPGSSWRDAGFDQTDRHPVVMVSWWDAMAYCRWASEVSGVTVRLPSEAEWESACRAGSKHQLPPDPDASAWHLGNSQQRTWPVASRAPNAWGLFDLHGNAWEWCMDSWSPDLAQAPADGRPRFDGGWFEPVMRGGSFAASRWFLQASRRDRVIHPARVNHSQGFRVLAQF